MDRLYLMRHATARKADGQAEHHMFSVGDEPLADKGQAEAKRMADLLVDEPIDAVVASPAKRCHETARIVAEPHGLEVEVDERLWEVPYGQPGDDYETVLTTIVQLAGALRTEDDPELPNGETWQEVTGRYRQALQAAREGHDRVLVVGHGAQNRAYLTHLLAMEPYRLFSLEQDHACLNLIGYGSGRVAVVKMNVTADPLGTEGSSLLADPG